MGNYRVKVTVEYEFDVSADDEADAERQGWDYEEYGYSSTVDSIEVREIESYDDEDE